MSRAFQRRQAWHVVQSVGTFLPSTAVRSVGVLIDHPPAATPPVTTGNSRCTSLRCSFCACPACFGMIKCISICVSRQAQRRWGLAGVMGMLGC